MTEQPISADEIVASTQWWETAGHDRASLTDAWRAVHHAAQPAAELAKAFGVPADDDSHTTFSWVHGKAITDGYFVGRLVETPGGVVRTALRLFDMTLFLINPEGDIHAEMPLEGKTVEQAHGWVLTTTMNIFDIPVRQATRPAPDLPEHPLGRGDVFAPPNQFALIELVRLYANTARLLEFIECGGEGGETLCWPHHFDLARLFILARDGDGAMAKTIGLGITPPDSVSDHGYWYVSGWSAEPTPPGAEAAALRHGQWREREGQPRMAVLEIAALHGIEERDAQHELVASFFADAINATRQMLA